MIKAAIICCNKSRYPRLLYLLAKPNINSEVFLPKEEGYNLFFIDLPVNDGQKISKRFSKIIEKFCGENNIEYLFQYSDIKVEWEIQPHKLDAEGLSICLSEVESIKKFAALIRISEISGKNVNKSNIAYISKHLSYLSIGAIAEEAGSIMIYEYEGISTEQKEELYNCLMNEKGISAVFFKDIGKLIDNCQVIITDDSIKLEEYADKLKNRLIIGSNDIKSGKLKVSRIILWPESLENLTKECAEFALNSEILAVYRYLNKNVNMIDFIRKLPYIYLLDEESKLIEKYELLKVRNIK